MNKKISGIQVGMLLYLICCSFYLGLNDIILLNKSSNQVLISMILGTLIGLIPVFMYLKINDTMSDLNIYEKNKKLFGKVFGSIINIIIILSYMIFLVIAIRAIVIFVTSKYLQVTPYIFVGFLAVLTCFIICYKGIETIARISQISFWASLILMIFIEIFLFRYVEIENILPIFTENYISNTLEGAIYHASTCGFLTLLLLSIKKSKIKNPKKYNITVLAFYLLSSVSLIIVMFFAVSCFGYKMASLFRYPEYILLKKIGLLNSELHLENLLAFRWIFYMLGLAIISLYGIMKGIENFNKNVKIKNILSFIIAIICMYSGKIIFGNIPHSIRMIKKYYIPVFALPVFILLSIIFIRCIIVKRKNKNTN